MWVGGFISLIVRYWNLKSPLVRVSMREQVGLNNSIDVWANGIIAAPDTWQQLDELIDASRALTSDWCVLV